MLIIMKYVNGCFVFLFVYLPSKFACSQENGIVCDTGHHVTSEVPVDFTVRRERLGFFGCIESLSLDETSSYPGSPEGLAYNVSTVDKSFTLVWRPPDDASWDHVTGFLLQMFIEETGDTHSSGTSACYVVDSKLAAYSFTGKDTQDAVFHLQCKMEEALNVKIYVKSLPIAARRKYKEVSELVTFQDTTTTTTTTTKSTTTFPNPRTALIDEDADVEDKTVSLVAIALGVVVISFVTVSIAVCIVCKNRSQGCGFTSSVYGNQQHGANISKDSYHQVLNASNTTSANAANTISLNASNMTSSNNNKGTSLYMEDKGTENCVPGNSTSTAITDDASQSCTWKANVSEVYTDINDKVSNGLNVQDATNESVPMPQPYRLLLQMINSDS